MKPKTSPPPAQDAGASSTAKPRSGVQGDVVIRQEICKGCGFCIEFCPRRCLEFSRGFNAKGYHYPELARPEDCIGCDLCGIYCPDFAIYGYRVKKPAK